MAMAYGEVPQYDNDDDDRNDDPSPSLSLSPAPSSSPMPFLPVVETTFTPLSMDNDFYAALGEGRESHEKDACMATVRAGAGTNVSISNTAQSLPSPPRATRNSLSEYGLQSPTPSPNATNFRPTERNSIGVGSALAREKESQAKETSPPQHQLDVQQLVILKPKPIVRTASTKSVSLRHPAPDLNSRSSSYVTNIAQLEATAEKLSMTSSIEDAIRDLHEEQKRNESRRSSILAASIGSIPEHNEPVSFPVTKPLSTTSSILETNTAARYGGYSPAGFIMPPNPSLLSNPTRLRSGSGPLSKPESEAGSVMSRHGPGKSSIRSVQSASKPTLTDIAEMEPTTLTPAAMDEADKLAEEPEGDETLRIPQMEDTDLTPNAEQYGMLEAYDYWDQAVAKSPEGHGIYHEDDRPPTSAGSTGTYEQAERAFADFDGAHCPPDVDLEESLFLPSFSNGPSTDSPFLRPFDLDLSRDEEEEEPDDSKPVISRPLGPPTVRPKSYMDPETGQTMLYYPARVPLMLNLPQKLSKKPKAELRNARRSQVLDKMAETNHEKSAARLPEFLPEVPFEPRESDHGQHTPMLPPPTVEMEMASASNSQNEPLQPQSHHESVSEEARQSRVSVADHVKRRTRLDGLPPQLRASTFFDLPSEVPTLQLKDGSAMATLDSILDASAKAPVSAFTDHAFAGTLGSEVYGTEKKRKSHMKRASATDLLGPKKRSSFLHLRKPSALGRHSESQDRQNTIAGGPGVDETLNDGTGQDEERQRLPSSIDGQAVPGQDEAEESDEEPVYDGPPTTLLAELQIRKQQQKLRTRPVATAYPNGLHSTLLEMDIVAQIERNTRKGKKVNLAWEEPNVDPADNSENEDTPLGLLLAAKGQGTDMTAAIAEINRPLGLMERRDMEDNEPLSRRRDRLQGREVGPMKRQSMMTLGQGLQVTSGNLRAPSPQLLVHAPDEEEVEGETLGERMRRLKAREQADSLLPQARPVSSAFSAELLSQLGDTFKEDGSDGKSLEKHEAQPRDEEETLGQRRRRLQAQREARERNMTSTILTGGAGGHAAKLTKRHSLADVLGARRSQGTLSDPRAEAEKARQEEAARYRQSQDQKMAAFRTPILNQPGDYMPGQFNGAIGGGISRLRTSTALSGYTGQGLEMMAHGRANSDMMGNNYPASGTVGVPLAYGAQVNAYTMQVQPPGQIDKVERWRQSVLP
ncbi:hypothetical protein GGR54DRAFT_311868 [Hypoxylon sp. NC1633]|nr:hypothetical protein GGR54DRAFT_311868 [Hypoxylon sp. NC1633]